MEHKGMVHALEEIHRILRTEGTLLDIHPVPEAPVVQVIEGDDVLFSAPDPGYDYDDDLHHAEAAVATVLSRGLYALDRSRDVDFLTHAASSMELRNYFASAGAYDPTPKDPTLVSRQEELYGRVDESMARSSGSAEVVYNERARLTRLLPVR
jgi:hypothetical protein